MSLHDDFIAAFAPDLRISHVLRIFSGQMALFASQIPGVVEDAIIRRKAGEGVYTGGEPTFRRQIDIGWGVGDINLATLETLPGYRQLVSFASDPDNDIALIFQFEKPYGDMAGHSMRVTIWIDPAKIFAESMVSFGYDKASIHKIGEKGPPPWVSHKSRKHLTLDKKKLAQP